MFQPTSDLSRPVTRDFWGIALLLGKKILS